MEGYHIIVEGRVQGVGFRYYTQRMAERLQITGTVENQWNGSVEIFAYGESEQLKRFLKYCSSGPPHSYVKNARYKKIEVQNLQSFKII